MAADEARGIQNTLILIGMAGQISEATLGIIWRMRARTTTYTSTLANVICANDPPLVYMDTFVTALSSHVLHFIQIVYFNARHMLDPTDTIIVNRQSPQTNWCAIIASNG